LPGPVALFALQILLFENSNELLGACKFLGISLYDANSTTDIGLSKGVPGLRKRRCNNCLELNVRNAKIGVAKDVETLPNSNAS
jgi:hypothetical protein